MAEAEVYKQIASLGIVGVLLVASLIALRSVYNSFIAEKTARIDDAQKFNTLALSMQKEMILATQSLVKIADAFEKREERLEREFAARAHTTPAAPFTPRRPFASKVDIPDDDEGGGHDG